MTEWRKSSFSGENTNCVEIAWRKSSFSGGNTDCVEIALTAGQIGVRDSKNPGLPPLVFPAGGWLLFSRSVPAARTGFQPAS